MWPQANLALIPPDVILSSPTLDKPIHTLMVNGCVDIFKRILLNKDIRISNNISPKPVLNKCPVAIGNKLALVWMMAWRGIGDKRLPEPTTTKFSNAYVELCLNEWTHHFISLTVRDPFS